MAISQMETPAKDQTDERALNAKPAHGLLSYVLITPARNEAKFIESAIKSVIGQTVLPLQWTIVSDGSTDGTDEIVARYAADYPWIKLVRTPERKERHFAGKVHAFETGRAALGNRSYDVIASLDADISFDDPDYFSFLLGKLEENPALGLVGTPFREGSGQVYDYRYVNIEHVSGACQVFRRECFDAIGGYKPSKRGGIDYVAVLSARMKGWKTRTFVEKICDHHREIGTAQHSAFAARFRNGIRDYAFGNHPVWEIFRVIYQLRLSPVVTGGVALASGYLWALLTRPEQCVPPELIDFTRREQMTRLKHFFKRSKAAVPKVASQKV